MVDEIYPNEEGSDEILKFMSSGSKGFSSLEEALIQALPIFHIEKTKRCLRIKRI